MNVVLLASTPNPIDVIYVSAKGCYSDLPSYKIEKTNVDNFIKGIIDSGHESVLEHASFTFSIEGISRSCSHQLVRHRVASYCLSGDTEVYTDCSNHSVKKRTVKQLYDMPKQYRDMTFLRSMNEESTELVSEKIVDVIYTGKKMLYSVVDNLGNNILTTREHRFLTTEGWKHLSELSEGSQVYTNGQLAYQSKVSTITSITEVGIQDTYDIIMSGPNHNFIGNGFVVHNSQQSQRYVTFAGYDPYCCTPEAEDPRTDYEFEKSVDITEQSFVVPPSIKAIGREKEFIDMCSEIASEDYSVFVNKLLAAGYTKEQAQEDARYLLPNAAKTNITVTMNLRELRHFFNQRMCKRAQWEIRELAWEMHNIVKEISPILIYKSGANCMFGECKEGKHSCGEPY